MAVIGAVLTILLAWMGMGHPFQPVWVLTLLSPIFWLMGIALNRRALFSLGFFGLLALSAQCVFSGNLPLGLGALSLTLFSWDSLAFFLHRKKFLKLGRAHLWSSLIVGSGIALGFAASILRFSLNFWILVGALALVWVFLRLLIREMAQGRETNGKRSTSNPTG